MLHLVWGVAGVSRRREAWCWHFVRSSMGSGSFSLSMLGLAGAEAGTKILVASNVYWCPLKLNLCLRKLSNVPFVLLDGHR